MKINKSLDIDLNILSPQKRIRIHEGDVDSVDILIGVSVDDQSVGLDDVTIKYDATINNYLAEQDADGSVVNGKISIPVTQNMTAMSGLLLIDVRMIQSDQILYTQTICATVEKAVVNGSTYIDFDKVTIIQKMNALETRMEYVEEIVENFDTSKLIVSTNRPPSGAPPEVDVNLIREGDTWIQQGDNIVYKLVEAQYNYQPAPETEPYHKFTWQPLNERYGVGNTEPPTTVTYQAVIYTINEVQWSWLPVPEYFTGDHYQMLVDKESTYFVCKSNLVSYTGVCTYTWREEGGSGDLSTKMDLAPLNPTAEEIAAMPDGQFYGDTVNHKGVVKGGQSFYDTEAIDNALDAKETTQHKSDDIIYHQGSASKLLYPSHDGVVKWCKNWCVLKSPSFNKRPPIYSDISVSSAHPSKGQFWLFNDTQTGQTKAYSFVGFIKYPDFVHGLYCYKWLPLSPSIYIVRNDSINNWVEQLESYTDYPGGYNHCILVPQYAEGDVIYVTDGNDLIIDIRLVRGFSVFEENDSKYARYDTISVFTKSDYYTKTEINNMIGDIETLLSEV